MTTLADIQIAYKYSLQDLGSILEGINSTATTAVRDAAITQAAQWYSRRIPQLKTVLVASVVGGYYAAPTDWIAGKSRAVSIEWPLNQTPPRYLLPHVNINMQRRETGMYYYVDPNPTGSYRLTYTADHTLTSSASSIDSTHTPIIGRMAASIACAGFSARFSNSVANNLDAVSYRSKAQEFRDTREALLKQIDEELRRDEYAQMYASDPLAGLNTGWK